jgi:hypothetical protein
MILVEVSAFWKGDIFYQNIINFSIEDLIGCYLIISFPFINDFFRFWISIK